MSHFIDINNQIIDDDSQLFNKSNYHQYNISYGRQSIDHHDINAVAQALQSSLITTGPIADAFEAALCNLTGAKHAIVCSNGTTALHLACIGLQVHENDLGLTSPITFLASANF